MQPFAILTANFRYSVCPLVCDFFVNNGNPAPNAVILRERVPEES
jgi:hypothetical protein